MSALGRHCTVLTDLRIGAGHLGAWTGTCHCEIELWREWLLLATHLVLFRVSQVGLLAEGLRVHGQPGAEGRRIGAEQFFLYRW